MQILNDSFHFGLPILLIGVCVAAAPACSASEDPATGGGRGGSGATGGTEAGGSGGVGGQAGAGRATTGTGGQGGTGGAAGKGGTGGAAGAGATAGASGAAGSAGAGGSGGASGGSGGAGKDGGAGASGAGTVDAGMDVGGTPDAGMDVGGTPDTGGPAGDGGARFSFFMTSLASLRKLSGNQNGFGGDLRFGKTNGLDGADEICKQVAEIGVPGNGKTWRAFLSVTAGPNGTPVNAIDRIGNGPWYDAVGRVFAMTKADLLNPRPRGADPAILNDFPNEFGVPNHAPDGIIVDNHNTLTGSNVMGAVNSTNKSDTCQDWTSSASSGAPRCGVSWPSIFATHWMSALNEGGCAPGVTPPGSEAGPAGSVGGLGGYGGFYCFALSP
jgi:hypothetical protein